MTNEIKITERTTAEFLADAFCRMGADEQQRFFVLVALRVQEWEPPAQGDETQWETVGDLVKRSGHADTVSELIAEWNDCFGRKWRAGT